MTKDEALKMAIECLEYHNEQGAWGCNLEGTIVICKEALEQPAQEPVAWLDEIQSITEREYYETKPAPTWQGLSEDEVDDFMFESCDAENGYSITDLIRLVEQALKEKNHG